MHKLLLVLLSVALCCSCSQLKDAPTATGTCPTIPDGQTAPKCPQLCEHTVTLAGGCGMANADVCLKTCRQVFDLPTESTQNKLKFCYLKAKSCSEIENCNRSCFEPAPVPDVVNGDL